MSGQPRPKRLSVTQLRSRKGGDVSKPFGVLDD